MKQKFSFFDLLKNKFDFNNVRDPNIRAKFIPLDGSDNFNKLPIGLDTDAGRPFSVLLGDITLIVRKKFYEE